MNQAILCAGYLNSDSEYWSESGSESASRSESRSMFRSISGESFSSWSWSKSKWKNGSRCTKGVLKVY